MAPSCPELGCYLKMAKKRPLRVSWCHYLFNENLPETNKITSFIWIWEQINIFHLHVGGYRTLSDPLIVTGNYLWIPFPSSLTSELAYLTYQWLPPPSPIKSLISLSFKALSSSFSCSFIWPCALELKMGLGTLERMSVGCHSLSKVVLTHHHAVFSAYLCICQASTVDAWPHDCSWKS